jgi:hypothetical protein
MEVLVKLLLLLVLLGAVAYFAPAPVGHAEQAIEINADRNKVWGVLADLYSARLWDPAMKDMKFAGDVKTGTEAERYSDEGIVKTREKVREWVAYNRLVFDVTHDPKITKFETSTIAVEPGTTSNSTRIRWTIDYRMSGGYLGQFADKFLLGSVHQGRISEGLSNLKRYAETGETPPTL